MPPGTLLGAGPTEVTRALALLPEGPSVVGLESGFSSRGWGLVG